MNEEAQKETTISFTVSEINQILQALGKIPAEMSMNIILFIKQTADAQVAQQTPVADSESGSSD